MNRFFVALVLMSASLLGTSSAYSSESRTPEQVISELVSAMEANDAEHIRSLFAENATQEYERWYARKKTGDKFRAWLESDIIDVHGRVTNPTLMADDKQAIVIGTYVNNDNYRSPADFLFIVEDGKIVSWTMRYD
ncbi:hypothetical protein BZG20_05795 [Salinivibrio sp. IB868]|uniref:nuclear transport factor 2 family protein n=1 Tax=unclassified Salinivibrio TaxID=2636825 RepID=UPI0009878F4D|nr:MULTISPECIES: nuclear transport factor 2 family protein [unclassified Salinivibrio]OOE67534.1 hypothetical protein BZG20_05795 [Salinivibrio sp. IB868]OOE71874.1 hypothetical protein BZG22_14685 [Salinivibrio sp. IB870]